MDGEFVLYLDKGDDGDDEVDGVSAKRANKIEHLAEVREDNGA